MVPEKLKGRFIDGFRSLDNCARKTPYLPCTHWPNSCGASYSEQLGAKGALQLRFLLFGWELANEARLVLQALDSPSEGFAGEAGGQIHCRFQSHLPWRGKLISHSPRQLGGRGKKEQVKSDGLASRGVKKPWIGARSRRRQHLCHRHRSPG